EEAIGGIAINDVKYLEFRNLRLNAAARPLTARKSRSKAGNRTQGLTSCDRTSHQPFGLNPSGAGCADASLRRLPDCCALGTKLANLEFHSQNQLDRSKRRANPSKFFRR